MVMLSFSLRKDVSICSAANCRIELKTGVDYKVLDLFFTKLGSRFQTANSVTEVFI